MMTAIVTGISEGLGYALGKKLLVKGYKVVGISRTKPDIKVEFIQADLTKKEELKKAVDTIKMRFSDFNFLFNVAGKLNIEPVNRIQYDELENLFRLNVLAPIALISELFDQIKQNDADIVNVGSTIGFKSYENQTAYTASKWAIRGLNENLRLELKGTRCRVIGFNPGGFKSKIFEKATGDEITDWTGYMDPEDLADLIITFIELPKNMEVSDVIVNRK